LYTCHTHATASLNSSRLFLLSSYHPPMFDFGHSMPAPSVSPLSYTSPDLLMFDDEQNKVNSSHLYFRQPYSLQVIQLVEGPPPPPRRITSVINDSSASSSSSSPYSSEYSDSSPSDEDEESVCSSYCSSDLSPEQIESPQSEDSTALRESTATYSIRMKRILAWRENFSPHRSTTLSGV